MQFRLLVTVMGTMFIALMGVMTFLYQTMHHPSSPLVSASFNDTIEQFLHAPKSYNGSYDVGGTTLHPVVDDSTADDSAKEATTKTKIENCQTSFTTRDTLNLVLTRFTKPRIEPMVIRNQRHGDLTMSLDPLPKKGRRFWSIAPDSTWRTETRSGQRWFVSDHKRCLFYLTASDEPIHLTVNSE